MADDMLSITTQRPYEEPVAAVREKLAEVGFGVLSGVDLRAPMRAVSGDARTRLTTALSALSTTPATAVGSR